MPLNFLGMTINNWPNQIRYWPAKVTNKLGSMKNLQGKKNEQALQTAKAAAARSFDVDRAGSVVGQSNVRPLRLNEHALFRGNEYNDVLDGIASTTGDSMHGANDILTTQIGGIAGPQWTSIKNGGFEANEMVGCMVAKFEYTFDNPQGGNAGTLPVQDYLVSAAANMMFNSETKAYGQHTYNANGEQVHTEMLLAAQFGAFLGELARLADGQRVRPAKWNQANRVGGAVEHVWRLNRLNIRVRILIEKPSFCPGCSGTWTDLANNWRPGLGGFDWEMA